MGVAAQKPQQLADDRAQVQLLRREQRKALARSKRIWWPKTPRVPVPGPVGLLLAVGQDVVEEIEILPHAGSLARRHRHPPAARRPMPRCMPPHAAVCRRMPLRVCIRWGPDPARRTQHRPEGTTCGRTRRDRAPPPRPWPDARRPVHQLPRLRARVLASGRSRHPEPGADRRNRRRSPSLGGGPRDDGAAVHPGVYLTHSRPRRLEVRAVGALLSVGGLVAAVRRQCAFRLGSGAPRAPCPAPRLAPRRPACAPSRAGYLRVTRTRHFEERVHASAWPHRTTVEHSVLEVQARRSGGPGRSPRLRALCQQQLTTEAGDSAQHWRPRPGQPHGALLRECLGDIGSGAPSQRRRSATSRDVRAGARPARPPTRQAVLWPGPPLRQPVRGAPTARPGGRRTPGGHEGWAGRVRDGVRDRAARSPRATHRAGLFSGPMWP